MLYYKPMSVKDLVSFWSGIEEVPLKEKDLVGKQRHRGRFDFDDEIYYAVIPVNKYGREQRSEYQSLKVNLSSGFRSSKISTSTTEHGKMMNDSLVRVFNIMNLNTPEERREEFLVVDTNKLAALEKIYPGIRFTNERWYNPKPRQDDENRPKHRRERRYETA